MHAFAVLLMLINAATRQARQVCYETCEPEH